MKKLLLQFLCLTGFFIYLTTAHASNFELCEKTYVLPEQTATTREGIFVKLDNLWFQTETLFSDSDGIFINNLSPSAYGCPDPYNPCRNCQRCVHQVYDICPYCNKPA